MTLDCTLCTSFVLLSVCLLCCPVLSHPHHKSADDASATQHADPAVAAAHSATSADAMAAAAGQMELAYMSMQESKPSASQQVEEITYDQRQNGTQNVRIHLDDVTVIVAPSEGIMSLFATQQLAAQYANASAQQQAQNASQSGAEAAPVAADPYAEFNELIDTANFLKKAQQSQMSQHGGAAAVPAGEGGQKKKCVGGRCHAKRTKLNLTKYLLPMLANRQQQQEASVDNELMRHQ